MDKQKIIDDSKNVHDEEAWSDFEMLHFAELFDARSKSAEEYERQSRRMPIVLNGARWEPVRSAKVVDKDSEFRFWKISAEIFSRLNPEAADDNAAHPERYDKYCIYCEIRTAERSLSTCPICEHELLEYPLNDIDDD